MMRWWPPLEEGGGGRLDLLTFLFKLEGDHGPTESLSSPSAASPVCLQPSVRTEDTTMKMMPSFNKGAWNHACIWPNWLVPQIHSTSNYCI